MTSQIFGWGRWGWLSCPFLSIIYGWLSINAISNTEIDYWPQPHTHIHPHNIYIYNWLDHCLIINTLLSQKWDKKTYLHKTPTLNSEPSSATSWTPRGVPTLYANIRSTQPTMYVKINIHSPPPFFFPKIPETPHLLSHDTSGVVFDQSLPIFRYTWDNASPVSTLGT